jgi:hypothetical protein
MQLLTHLSTTHCLALFSVQCPTTRLRVEELNETVSLLYGYLSEHAVSVEAMEDVALCDFFSGKIAFEHGLEAHGRQQDGGLTNEETRAHGELIPLSFGHKLPLLVEEFLV